ncbi:MAG: tRNA (adenosine(37)-N6)-threonylcarbamoyltransferase complex dimerization subunit type 1 TsaB [Candidatus Omnitrophica bacterium CG11_big_fil_rev_8_21_14_0_20_63_9]|nr:MAG: tRNA (adenosine(37)-N6)-threonylcarbamoyltransferase complex dimerization subunit type 1 TsaB [Candidatus Omnitrophica bacterium CG11_big_fil_rev_8_21_14_0_20_63_9]
MLLAIDTSSRQLGIALWHDGQIASSYELLAEYPHAVELPAAVKRVLETGHATLAQLDAIAVGLGPGSFTGLRIGLAFVKAMAFAAKKPVIGVPSLDVIAANVSTSPGLVCAFLDARQKNVYAGLFRMVDSLPQKASEYFLGPPADFLKTVKEPVILVGDGCALYRALVEERLGGRASFAPQELWLPRVTVLARLAAARFAAGQRDDAAALVPLYLYPLDCSVRGPDRPTAVLPKAAVSSTSA